MTYYLTYYKEYCYNILRYYLQPWIHNQCNISEIKSNIYLSDFASTIHREEMKDRGITHILSIIVGMVPLYPEDFTYKNIYLQDITCEDIYPHLDECADYIKSVIDEDGKILVHCSQGVSRSATAVIAYLIKYDKMNFQDAYKFLKDKRYLIEPNNGFRKQLLLYELSQPFQF